MMNNTQLKTLEKCITWWKLGYNVLVTPPDHAVWMHWKQYTTNRQTIADIIQMIEYKPFYTNVALITGINNLLVLDFDHIADYTNFIINYPQFLDTYTVKTVRGYHLHYKTLETLPREKLEHLTIPGVEVFTFDKFAQLPGNQHKNGGYYELIKNGPIMSIDSHRDLDTLIKINATQTKLDAPRSTGETLGNTGNTSHNVVKVDNQAVREKAPFSFPLFFIRRNTRPTTGSVCQKINNQLDIRSLLPNSDFIKSGTDYMAGFCPFHDDQHRSLSLHLPSNKVKCLSPHCIAGDKYHSIIDVLMMHENITHTEAIKKLSKYVKD